MDDQNVLRGSKREDISQMTEHPCPYQSLVEFKRQRHVTCVCVYLDWLSKSKLNTGPEHELKGENLS